MPSYLINISFMKTRTKKSSHDFSFSKKEDIDNFLKSAKADSKRMNDIKFMVLRCFLKPYIKGANVLDLGCGDAFYLDFLLDDGLKNYMGVDISRAMIDRVRINKKRKRDIRVIVGDMADEKLVLDNSFDCALSIFSLMRIKNVSKIFKIVNKKIKKGGVFLVMTNTYITKDLELKNFMVEIKKNEKVFFNNYPRSADQFVKTANKQGFTFLYNFSKPFSKDKVITSPNTKKIAGFDSILMFKKE